MIEVNGLIGTHDSWIEGHMQRLGVTDFDNDIADWRSSKIKKYLRVRYLADTGYPVMGLSYAYVETVDGGIARLHAVPGQDGFGQTPRRWKAAAINDAKKAGIFLKGQGFFDAVSILY